MRHEIDLPGTFAEDHEIGRCLPSGERIGWKGKLIRYACTVEELEEWLSDARYYSDCAGQGWSDARYNIGLQSSARATAKRVQKKLDSISK